MYKIFCTEAEAMQYSHQIAIEHGRGKATDVIQYWYGWRETTDGKWAVRCPEGTETPEFLEVTDETI